MRLVSKLYCKTSILDLIWVESWLYSDYQTGPDGKRKPNPNPVASFIPCGRVGWGGLIVIRLIIELLVIGLLISVLTAFFTARPTLTGNPTLTALRALLNV